MSGHYAKAENALRQAFAVASGCASVCMSVKRAVHILYGDKTGGRHLCEFPHGWRPQDVLAAAIQIAANDTLPVTDSIHGRKKVTDTINDVLITVVLDPQRKNIITAYPVNRTKERSMKDKFQNSATPVTDMMLAISARGKVLPDAALKNEAKIVNTKAEQAVNALKPSKGA